MKKLKLTIKEVENRNVPTVVGAELAARSIFTCCYFCTTTNGSDIL